MDLTSIAWFFLIMLALAALPSSSVALVVIRAATHGVANEMAVAAGIVVGDLVFIALVLLSLSVMSASMGSDFTVLTSVGDAYLLLPSRGVRHSLCESPFA